MADSRSITQTTTTISLPKSLLAAGRMAAQQQGIDFSRLVRAGLVELCRKQGIMLPDEEMIAPPPRGVERINSEALGLNETAEAAPVEKSAPIDYKKELRNERRKRTKRSQSGE